MGLGPSPMEIAVIAVIALIVLGPNKLPEAARSLGKGFREMRDSFQGAAKDDDDEGDLDEDDLDEEEVADDEDTAEAVADHAAGIPVGTGSAPQPELDQKNHQNDARSSVPSASSSSSERE